MTAPDPDRVRELVAEAQLLIRAMDGVWKETPAVKLVSLMARDGSALLAAAEAWADAQERIAELERDLAEIKDAYEQCKAGRAELFAERDDLRRKHDALTRLYCNPENDDA